MDAQALRKLTTGQRSFRGKHQQPADVRLPLPGRPRRCCCWEQRWTSAMLNSLGRCHAFRRRESLGIHWIDGNIGQFENMWSCWSLAASNPRLFLEDRRSGSMGRKLSCRWEAPWRYLGHCFVEVSMKHFRLETCWNCEKKLLKNWPDSPTGFGTPLQPRDGGRRRSGNDTPWAVSYTCFFQITWEMVIHYVKNGEDRRDTGYNVSQMGLDMKSAVLGIFE